MSNRLYFFASRMCLIACYVLLFVLKLSAVEPGEHAAKPEPVHVETPGEAKARQAAAEEAAKRIEEIRSNPSAVKPAELAILFEQNPDKFIDVVRDNLLLKMTPEQINALGTKLSTMRGLDALFPHGDYSGTRARSLLQFVSTALGEDVNEKNLALARLASQLLDRFYGMYAVPVRPKQFATSLVHLTPNDTMVIELATNSLVKFVSQASLNPANRPLIDDIAKPFGMMLNSTQQWLESGELRGAQPGTFLDLQKKLVANLPAAIITSPSFVNSVPSEVMASFPSLRSLLTQANLVAIIGSLPNDASRYSFVKKLGKAIELTPDKLSQKTLADAMIHALDSFAGPEGVSQVPQDEWNDLREAWKATIQSSVSPDYSGYPDWLTSILKAVRSITWPWSKDVRQTILVNIRTDLIKRLVAEAEALKSQVFSEDILKDLEESLNQAPLPTIEERNALLKFIAEKRGQQPEVQAKQAEDEGQKRAAAAKDAAGRIKTYSPRDVQTQFSRYQFGYLFRDNPKAFIEAVRAGLSDHTSLLDAMTAPQILELTAAVRGEYGPANYGDMYTTPADQVADMRTFLQLASENLATRTSKARAGSLESEKIAQLTSQLVNTLYSSVSGMSPRLTYDENMVIIAATTSLAKFMENASSDMANALAKDIAKLLNSTAQQLELNPNEAQRRIFQDLQNGVFSAISPALAKPEFQQALQKNLVSQLTNLAQRPAGTAKPIVEEMD